VCLWLVGLSRCLAIASERTPLLLIDVHRIGSAVVGTLITTSYPFGSEILFIPNKVSGEEQLPFQPKAAVGIFLGYVVDSGCLWNGACIVAHVSEFTTLNYHTGRREETTSSSQFKSREKFFAQAISKNAISDSLSWLLTLLKDGLMLVAGLTYTMSTSAGGKG
jgi:hypothetical protein